MLHGPLLTTKLVGSFSVVRNNILCNTFGCFCFVSFVLFAFCFGYVILFIYFTYSFEFYFTSICISISPSNCSWYVLHPHQRKQLEKARKQAPFTEDCTYLLFFALAYLPTLIKFTFL